MNNLTKQNKIIVFGGIAVIIAVALFLVWFLNSERAMKEENQNTVAEQEVVKVRTTEALKIVADAANELSGIASGAVFNFGVADMDGRSANFGIVQWVNDAKGERIVEEHFVLFRSVSSDEFSPKTYYSEVDRTTNKVVSMHRPVPEFAASGAPLPVDSLEATARQFVARVYPEFEPIESTLIFQPGSKTAPGVPANHFFRWNDKQFAVPNGLDMDLPPFIQVGINSRGFIFSYDNTVQLYHNLPKEALRAICGFVEMPKSDDSLIDREKGMVKVYFTEYEPFQNRFLVLPYEPETDFEGCSESAKSFLRHIQETVIPQINNDNETRGVRLYYYNSAFDRDETGNIMCSRKGLAAVKRKIPSTINPIKDTINLLLKGELLKEEKDRGVTTEYPLDGLTLKNIVLNNGVLTLAFDDTKNKTVGGACRVGILWFQIEATAKQFPEVKEVRFLPEELFQP